MLVSMKCLRRTNEERSATTRARILDATAACLMERGYAGTSTTQIAKMAGVSRGAQLHHFPIKSELMGAAVEHVFVRRKEEFQQAFLSLPDETDKISAAIDLLWNSLQTGVFYAWLELVVASRSDEVLKERLLVVCQRFDRDITDLVQTLFNPPPEALEQLHVAGHLLFASVEGLCTSQIVYGRHRSCDEMLALLKTIVHQGLRPYLKGVSL